MSSVYFVRGGELTKIGFSERPMEFRVRELQTGSPVPLEVARVISPGSQAVESAMHRLFEADRVSNEWFRLPEQWERIVDAWMLGATNGKRSQGAAVEMRMTVTQAAAMLQVEHKTIRRLIDRGDLSALRVGRVLRIDPAALEALMYEPRRPQDVKWSRHQSRPRPVTGEFAERVRAS